jgi:hypothetical protein
MSCFQPLPHDPRNHVTCSRGVGFGTHSGGAGTVDLASVEGVTLWIGRHSFGNVEGRDPTLPPMLAG